jgi:O-antigen/teichoic acid export membrane protein
MTDRASGRDSAAGGPGAAAEFHRAAVGRHRRADDHPTAVLSTTRYVSSGRERQPESGQRGTGHRTAQAAWWLFANTLSARAGTVVIGLAVARLVSPREFGAVAVAIVALLGMRSLDLLGAGRAIVRWDGDLREVAPTAMTISLVSALAIYAGCYAAAPAFAGVMGAPAVARVIRVLALSVVISATAAAPEAMIQRRSPRAVRVLVDQAGTWVGVGMTIGLAAAGHGLMSLAVGSLAGSAVSAATCMMFAPQGVRIGFRPSTARAVLRAGLPLAASSVLFFAATNADLIVIGHLLRATSLGFYLLAVSVASWPVELFSEPVRGVAPGAFARFRLTPRVGGSAFLSTANRLACLTAPVCILISVSADYLIRLAYGAEWAPAAAPLVWLAPLAALRVLYELVFHFVGARTSLGGRLNFQTAFLVALVPSLVAGVRWDGIVGAAIAQVAVCALLVIPYYFREVAQAGRRAPALAARLTLWLAAAVGVGWVAAEIRHPMIPQERLGLVLAVMAALAITSGFVYRMRAEWRAVRSAASRVRSPWPDAARAPMLLAVVERPRYATLGPVPLSVLAPPEPSSGQDATAGTEQHGLGRKVKSGAWWSIANTVTIRVATFATTIVLARTVFGPEAFGLYAVSQVILALLLSVNEMAVSLAIVRWDGDVRTFTPTVFTLSVGFSTLIYGGLYVVAPEAARLLGTPSATGLVRLMSVCVIIDGLICVPFALLTRAFAQRRLMAVNALNFVVTTGVTFWLAYSGVGAISFAWGAVLGGVVSLIAAFLTAPFLVRPGWNTGQVRSLLRFGLPLAGASLLMLGVYNVDSLIVGATLGPVALGLYQLAFNISSWPARSISEAARRVSFAGFSRVAHSAELLADGFTRALGLVMAATVPACVLLATLAEPLVRLVYGERWTPAAHVLTLLSILGLLRVAYDLTYDCLAAAGKRPTLLGVQGWWLAALIPVLLVGARTRGIVGVGAGHVVVAGLLVCPAFLWALSRCGIRVRSILAACLRPFLGGVLMIAASELVLRAVGGSLAGVAAATVAAAAVYLPVVFPMRAMLRPPRPAPAVPDEARAA